MTVRTSFIGNLIVLGVLATAGQASAQGINVDYYTPQFYMDRLVFYDETGAPVYYEGDTAYSVPSGDEVYERLVNHYQQNSDAYLRWFEQVGYTNLNYRRPVAAAGYQPMYYEGSVVYYDDAGRPIYYVDGQPVSVPPDYGEYPLYVRHYRTHRGAYIRWNGVNGLYFRRYRRPLATGYYTPMYYDGYVVFYDDGGVPYYYQGGRQVYIPRTHPSYGRFFSHYRTHRQGYRRWYGESGRRNHGYRQPSYYRTRSHATAAPRAMHGRAMERRYQRRPERPGPRPDRPGFHGRPQPRPDRPGFHGQPQPRPDRPGFHGQPPPRPDRPGHGGGVDCRRNPGHPACRREPPRHERRQERREERREQRRERRRR